MPKEGANHANFQRAWNPYPARVARLRLSPHCAEPISLVWASEHLLPAAAAQGPGFAAGVICKQQSLKASQS